jgi:UDP-2,3-diacylglucosamine pyrophosphatase LpxH
MIDTIIVSDLHLADDEPSIESRPMWKRYKSKDFFFDDDLINCIKYVIDNARDKVELIFNGDTFDFDGITKLPEEPFGKINWLAKQHGLSSQEWMSVFKMDCIIEDHYEFFEYLKKFLEHGHKIVFVTGNHDLEILWPKVQEKILKAIGIKKIGKKYSLTDQVVFCSWFYISNQDTYISHGHQYDPFCSVRFPIDPLIRINGVPHIRLPFGELAQRYMLNTMGYFNPHASENYIMSFKQYLNFFFKYLVNTQPFILITWFTGAIKTLIITYIHFLRPALRDPLLVEDKVDKIAKFSQSTSSMVRKLNAVHVFPACINPLLILKELWLDRGFLLLGIIFLVWQMILTINFIFPINPWWGLLLLVILSPFYLLYSYSIHSHVFKEPLLSEKRANLIGKITKTDNIVLGHNHIPDQYKIGNINYYNSGFWSPAFADPECKTRIGTRTFVWIKPALDEKQRSINIYEWKEKAIKPNIYQNIKIKNNS